jgi:hypothetical protein
MLNVFFLLVYAVGSGFFDGGDLMILLTIHFGLLVFNHLRQKNTIITPILIFYVGVIIVNVANLDLIGQVAARNIRTYNYIIPRYIDQAALIWCISSTLCVIGYNIAVKRSLPSISFELRRESILQSLFWILLCANILTIIGYGAALKGNQMSKFFGLLNTIGILFFARLWGKEDNRTFRLYAICLFLIETYVALVSSYLRFELILPTFYLTVGYFVGKGDIRYIFSYRILPVLAALLFYSSVFSSLQRNRSNFIAVFTKENAGEDVSSEPASGGLMDRSANLAQITNVVNLVEKNGFYEGGASSPILIALIPRILWPDKPLIQLGAWFALEIGVGSKTEIGTSNNSINMTVAGELYLDFGWLGVVFGSLFFGAFLAVLWNATHFYQSEYNITGTIFGGYLFILSLGSYADLQIVITLLSTYLFFYFVKRIASHYENSRYRTAVERK